MPGVGVEQAMQCAVDPARCRGTGPALQAPDDAAQQQLLCKQSGPVLSAGLRTLRVLCWDRQLKQHQHQDQHHK